MSRRRAIALIVIAIVALLLVALLALRWAMRPETLGPRVLDLAGQALGLEITADAFDYRLRGSPQLVARGVVAREPGAAADVLTAERIMVSVPWSTLRARGADPTITRIELDAPRLDLAAFQQWWSRRTPGEGPPPTLSDGLRIDRGRIDGAGWSLRDIALSLPYFAPGAPLRAHVRGRYLAPAVQARFDLHLAMTRPAADAGIGAAGDVTARGGDWRLPAHLVASTRLSPSSPASGRDDGAGLRLQGLRLSMHARHLAGDSVQAFALGLAAGGRVEGAALHLQPASVDLRGRGMVPRLHARGGIAFADGLDLALDGELARWPEAWPALPPPLDAPAAPLPFALRYRGPADLADPVELQLRQDRTEFEARVRVAAFAGWLGAAGDGSPLPPLDGRLRTPRLDLAGASLHGVEISIEDPPPRATPPGDTETP